MTQEETKHLGVKPTEEKTVATADPVEEKTPGIVEAIDSVLDVTPKEEAFKVETKDYDDDSVVISKTDLEALKKKTKDGENYRKGLLSLKENAKNVKQPKSEKKEVPGDDKGYLDKDEFYGSIEKVAIRQACEEEDVNTHWAEIMPYYTARRGKTTSADIVEDINDAYTLFRKYHPKSEEAEDKETIIKLSNDKAETKNGLNQGGKANKKKTLFPKSDEVGNWYS